MVHFLKIPRFKKSRKVLFKKKKESWNPLIKVTAFSGKVYNSKITNQAHLHSETNKTFLKLEKKSTFSLKLNKKQCLSYAVFRFV